MITSLIIIALAAFLLAALHWLMRRRKPRRAYLREALADALEQVEDVIQREAFKKLAQFLNVNPQYITVGAVTGYLEAGYVDFYIRGPGFDAGWWRVYLGPDAKEPELVGANV